VKALRYKVESLRANGLTDVAYITVRTAAREKVNQDAAALTLAKQLVPSTWVNITVRLAHANETAAQRRFYRPGGALRN
jgi:hypothetical protein